jgi:hypothetical protein
MVGELRPRLVTRATLSLWRHSYLTIDIGP